VPLTQHFFLRALLLFVLIAAWDASGADLAWVRLLVVDGEFALRNNFWLTSVLHDGARTAMWLLLLAFATGIAWPWGPLKTLTKAQRVQLVVSAVLCILVINLLKRASTTSCPWDLQLVGGVAQYVSHWRWGVQDGGPGHCFPGGHAVAGFAFLGAYFVWRQVNPRCARTLLVFVLLLGFGLGFAQQLRGAHYFSHNAWTAWLCWVISALLDAAGRLWQWRQTGRAAQARSARSP
jgi:membrane-associated PAP2 superfamily phosphatase